MPTVSAKVTLQENAENHLYVGLMAVEESTAKFCPLLVKKVMKVLDAALYLSQPMHPEVKQPHHQKKLQ